MTGATLASTLGTSAAASVSASSGKNHNEVQTAQNGKAVYCTGTHENPVKPDLMESVHNRLKRNAPKSRNRNSIMLRDPHAEPKQGKKSPSEIIGYAAKWNNGTPSISVRRGGAPAAASDNQRKEVENEFHREIREFAKGRGGEK
jgi:hypothetical protein